MRNIDIPGAKEIFAKQDDLMSTFWQNRGYVKATLAVHEAVREDYFFEKMNKLRIANIAVKAKAAAHQRMLDDFDRWGCE